MPITKELKLKIEQRLGARINYSSDCERLALAIEDVTGERIGATTIKRMFGFAGRAVTHRASTMDIIARYLGYNDFKSAANQIPASQTPASVYVKKITIESLTDGQQINIQLNANEPVTLTYIGNRCFIVNESRNPMLQKGDRIFIQNPITGSTLQISKLIRNGMKDNNLDRLQQCCVTSLTIIG